MNKKRLKTALRRNLIPGMNFTRTFEFHFAARLPAYTTRVSFTSPLRK